MFFSRILWILAVIAFATGEVLLLAGLIPAARSETFIGKAVGLCRHARKGALVGLLVSLGIIEGAYEVLSVEKQPDGCVITYTYGDFYSHDTVRSSRLTVENGNMIITDMAQ